MPLPAFSGPLGYKRAAHLLHRASFGPTQQQITAFAGLTAAQAVAQLFPASLPNPLPLIDPENNQEWVESGVTAPDRRDSDLQEIFKGWLIAQMLSAGVPANQSLAYSVREKVVFFLHTLFTAIQTKIDSSRALYFQNQLFRQFAFDRTKPAAFNLRELTKKICVDNAMLRLLDGNLNVRGGIQENFARELFELYSIGRGLEGTTKPVDGPSDYYVFRELDVQQAAKVFTGWDFDPDFSFVDPDTQLRGRGRVRGNATNASAHDNSVKVFSDRLAGFTLTPDPLLLNGANATEESALDEINQLIDHIYQQPQLDNGMPEAAKNICRRIYRYFVYHDIPEALDTTIIYQMAETFRSNGFKLQPVLEDLFRSQHFYEAAAGTTDDNFGAIIKSPLDLLIGTYRFFNVPMPDLTSSPAAYYERTGEIIQRIGYMGMNFYEPFDVAGYDAYHQFPIYHRSWITTNYLARRYDFITSLIPQTSMGGAMTVINVVNYVENNVAPATAANARNLVIELARQLLPQADSLTYDTNADANAGLTAERLNYFLNAFLGSIDPDPETAWTTRWTGARGEVVENQLRNLFNALLQSPEYQLF